MALLLSQLRSIQVSSIKSQMITGIVIGFCVFLILAIFQPFGTFEFSMRNKALFLAGYGVICTSIYFVYYFLTMTVLKKWFTPLKWNIVKEITTIIPVLILISMVSLYYHHEVIGGYEIGMGDVFYFFRISLAVAVIPFSVLLYRKWLKSSLTTIVLPESDTDYSVTFNSNNKNEKPVTVVSSGLLYIKSEGNYIEIARKNNDGIKTHLIRNSLNQVESILPERDFKKIHRSFIVNTNYIESISLSGSSYTVRLEGVDLKLPVSRSMVKVVREILDKQ